MADVKPLKLEDVGGGRGELREFGASDTVPPSNLPDNVKALANLTGVADRLPYFTGAGALSLTTLTGLARNLLDDTTQSGMQSTLGLVKQTSATDTTAGALLINGAFGRNGGRAIVGQSGDLNTYITSGTYSIDSGVLSLTNGPALTHPGSWILDVVPFGMSGDVSQVHQVLSRRNGEEIWQRSFIFGGWTQWSLKLGHQQGWITTDLNSLTTSGFYNVGGSSTNGPFASAFGHLVVHAVDTVTVHQVFTVAGSTMVLTYSRTLRQGVWGTWRTMYSQDTVLGTVSQSGGVPTGAIIERGSNANGTYVKYADGTLICAFTRPTPSISVTTTPYAVTSWTFPAAFLGSPVYASAINISGWVYQYLCGYETLNSTGIGGIYILRGNGSDQTQIHYITHYAIGRWF